MLRTIRVSRAKALPEAGGHTLYLLTRDFGGRGTFFQPHQVPEFEGDEAWFQVERKGKKTTFLAQLPPPPF